MSVNGKDKNIFMGSHPYDDMNWQLPDSDNSKVNPRMLVKLQTEYDNPKLKSKFRPSFLRSHYMSSSKEGLVEP